jgi:hypothetical protein
MYVCMHIFTNAIDVVGPRHSHFNNLVTIRSFQDEHQVWKLLQLKLRMYVCMYVVCIYV